MYRGNGIVMVFPLGANKGLLQIWLWENLGYVYRCSVFFLKQKRVSSARVHIFLDVAQSRERDFFLPGLVSF
jgi:hypothetical protein